MENIIFLPMWTLYLLVFVYAIIAIFICQKPIYNFWKGLTKNELGLITKKIAKFVICIAYLLILIYGIAMCRVRWNEMAEYYYGLAALIIYLIAIVVTIACCEDLKKDDFGVAFRYLCLSLLIGTVVYVLILLLMVAVLWAIVFVLANILVTGIWLWLSKKFEY